MSFSRGDAVVIEGTRHEGEEGRILEIDNGEAFLDILGSPGKTRTVATDNLADSPWTENEDWTRPKTESENDKPRSTGVPSEFEAFDEGDRVEVIESNDERFVGAEGEVLDAEKINGDWSVMVFLDMPHDRNRDFAPSDLEKIS